jgi:hypothetical protein
MIKREWLLGVGLLSGGIGLGIGPGLGVHPALAQSGSTIGAVAAVKPDAFGTQPSAAEQTLTIGSGLVENERIRTNADGTANVIFADRSTLTVGKGSEVVLDKFVYDPESKSGGIVLNLTQGALRFVGGQLAKSGDVKVKTPTATMTVRGAIALFFFPPGGGGYAVLVYGNSLTDDATGQSVLRAGFALHFLPDGKTEVVKMDDQLLSQIVASFNTQTGVGVKFPDTDLALLEGNLGNPDLQNLIDDLRNQIDELSQRDNTVLDSLRQFMVTDTTISS